MARAAAARRGRQRAADREDRARRGDHVPRRDHRRLRRHHGRARRPRGRSRQRRGARAAEAHDPAGARAQQAHDHGDADDGVDDPQAGARRAPKSPTSPTPCWTAPTRSCCPPRPRRATIRSRRSRRWRRSASRPRSPTRSNSTAISSTARSRASTSRSRWRRCSPRTTCKVKAIAALTQSGSTALWMSRHNCGCPIFALTPEVAAQRQDGALPQRAPALPRAGAATATAVLRAAEDLLLDEGAGAARRPDRADDRRADGQVRRHQHDEDRQSR